MNTTNANSTCQGLPPIGSDRKRPTAASMRPRRPVGTMLAATISVLLGVSVAHAQVSVLINEVDSDTAGTDALEFVELYDGGVGTTSLDGLVVVFFNGGDDMSYDAFDLDGFSTNAAGFFTLGNAGVTGVDLVFSGNSLQNGADAVALYAGNATDFPDGTSITTTNLIDAIVYDTSDADDAGLLPLLNAAQPQVDEASGGDSTLDSLQRCPDGAGGARNTIRYVALAPTPDATNSGCPIPTGACCRGTDCGVTTETACDDGSGTYQGDFTTCDLFECCGNIDDCNDGFGCTDDDCNFGSGTCQHSRNDSYCTDGPGGADGFTCTDDACNPANAPVGSTTGCQTTRVDARCDDGFSCTDEACNPANAPAGSTTGCQMSRHDDRCDDGFSCTDDACNPANAPPGSTTGCQMTRVDSRCDDGFTCTEDGCNPANAPPGSTSGCQTSKIDARCDDYNVCTADGCNPEDPNHQADTGCVFQGTGECCMTDADCPPSPIECTVSYCDTELDECKLRPREFCRVEASKKGSLLMYSKVELRWAAGFNGALRQDTVLELTNDFSEEVCVQLYFVNGDEPLDEIRDAVTGGLIAEAEPGWEWVDCQFCMTPDETTYWSAATGLPAGCQPFTTLDSNNGAGPGRPDPNTPGERHLRGFVYAWAVDRQGHAISWNHLSGGATLINYFNSDAWDYNAWAFQAHGHCLRFCEAEDRCENPTWECGLLPNGARIGEPGQLRLDGIQYDRGFDMLLMDFLASGSVALSHGAAIATLDTDLTLHPITADLRQDSIGPVTTKAEFAVWNEDERRFSGTTRCITCWDQTLLSLYGVPNHFLRQYLQTDKGKTRIDGVRSNECDLNCVRENGSRDDLDISFILDILGIDQVCSYDAAMLGVVAKVLAFSGTAAGRASAGRTLVGMGTEAAWIKWNIVAPPGNAQDSAAGLRSDRGILKSPATRERADSARPVELPGQ